MPSFKTAGVAGEFGFMKCGKNEGITIKITHIPTNRSARFIGALTNFSDNYTSTWKEEPVYGRMDPISTFQRTGRKIDISWFILNESEKIGRENMTEVTKLINFLYPKYFSSGGGATTISTAPVLKLQFTNLANRPAGGGLVGYLSGFNFKPNIDIGWVKTSGTEMIPKQIDASINFTVLHTDSLGWTDQLNNPRTPGFPYGRTLKPDAAAAERETAKQAARADLMEAAAGTSLEFFEAYIKNIEDAGGESALVDVTPQDNVTEADRETMTENKE